MVIYVEIIIFLLGWMSVLPALAASSPLSGISDNVFCFITVVAFCLSLPNLSFLARSFSFLLFPFPPPPTLIKLLVRSGKANQGSYVNSTLIFLAGDMPSLKFELWKFLMQACIRLGAVRLNSRITRTKQVLISIEFKKSKASRSSCGLF